MSKWETGEPADVYVSTSDDVEPVDGTCVGTAEYCSNVEVVSKVYCD